MKGLGGAGRANAGNDAVRGDEIEVRGREIEPHREGARLDLSVASHAGLREGSQLFMAMVACST